MDMDGMSSRRGFLRSLVGEVVRGAQEIAPVLNLPGDLTGASAQERGLMVEAPAPIPRHTLRAAPVAHPITLEQLLELAHENDLGERLDAVRTLARRSFRITHDDDGGEGPFGPDLPPGVRWPHWNGDGLPFLTQIDLAALGEDGAATPLPSHGLLSVFCAGGGALACNGPAPDGAVRVLWLDGEDTGRTTLAQRPATSSSELMLPRVWAAPVQELGLDGLEQLAWQELRKQLAELQGIVLPDVVDGATEIGALHRLLGYPDERIGTMPLACEFAARGIELEDGPVYGHSRATELAPYAHHWRLLLQLTVDEELGWSWGERRDRLYIWIHEQDLAAHDFSRVWAIAQ